MQRFLLRHLGEAADLQDLDLPPPIEGLQRRRRLVELERDRRVVAVPGAELDVHCRGIQCNFRGELFSKG